MGAYLSQPVTDKEAEEKENQDYKYGACAMQGWRTEMEDAHLADLDFDRDASLFGVFDGHGGSEVAKFAAMYLTKELVNTQAYRASDQQQALVQAFLRIDELLALESTQEELHTLAGPHNPEDEEEMSAMLNEENLPELLRIALQQRREEEEREDSPGTGSEEEAGGSGEAGPHSMDCEEATSSDKEAGNNPEGHAMQSSERDSIAPRAPHCMALSETGLMDCRMARKQQAVDSEEATSSDKDPGGEGHWKSTADSGPDSRSALLSKESIVPQRSQAVHDQPTSDSSVKGNVNKRSRSHDPSSPSPDSSSPPDGSALLPVGRRSRAKAKAPIKRNRSGGPFQEAESESEASEALVSDSVEKAEPLPIVPLDYKGPSAGCTAVVALVQNDQLLVANAGDSRCVVSEGGKAIAMSYDHKPTDAAEHSRITKAGGLVMDGRVNGSLNLSRALGDMEYKQSKNLPPAEQIVTAFPDVRKLQLSADVEFMILACDGIWDVLSNQQAVDFVRQRLLEGQSPKYISESVCEHCLAKDTGGTGIGCDNMSVMVILFKRFSNFSKTHAASVAKANDATNLYSS